MSCVYRTHTELYVAETLIACGYLLKESLHTISSVKHMARCRAKLYLPIFCRLNTLLKVLAPEEIDEHRTIRAVSTAVSKVCLQIDEWQFGQASLVVLAIAYTITRCNSRYNHI